ncbi:MAG: type II secretion system protein [Phycisphaerales bacterium]|nr:type II secretion system protein [Phycisphaerales bacterium]
MRHEVREPIRHGYTLVELMVVLAIIGVLLAMAFGGFILARRAAMQSSQSNNLRQLGLAWAQYNTASRGRFVPGWVSPDAQRDGRMVLAYPDTTLIPPAPSFSQTDPNIAGPWTWRLVPYLGNDLSILIGPDEQDLLPILDYEKYGEQVAYEPAFAYNGWYVGGHYTVPPGAGRAILSFSRARLGDRTYSNLVAESIGRMRHPSTLVVFLPGAKLAEPGSHSLADPHLQMWFEATPPYLADQEMWRVVSPDDVDSLEPDIGVPRLSHGMDTPVFHADGSINTEILNTLRKQNLWIDGARVVEGTPAEEFTHEAE